MALLLLAACTQEGSSECQFQIPQGQTAECGHLVVPEDRTNSDGPTITLPFAVFKSRSDNPAPDPIVYLAGGPGEKALESVPLIFDHFFTPFLADRDVIVFDQRGAGFSDPALDCPEYQKMALDTLDQDLSVEEEASLSTEAISDCHDRLLADGANLAAYTTAENAADLSDLRQVLGYEEWNLYGGSYGTKLDSLVKTRFEEVPAI